MSRVLISSVASIIAGLAIGWLAGSGRGDGGGLGGQGTSNSPATLARRHPATDGEAGPRRDFASYVKRIERQTSHPEAEQAMARMSREELQALLLETPEYDMRRTFNMSEHLREKLSDAAAAELLRRDGIAAVEWAEASGCRGAWAALVRALASIDPAAAKERAPAYFAGSVPRSSLELGILALNGAATRSAKDVIDCLKFWDDISFEYVTEYEPGFDFGAVLAHIEAIRDNPRLREIPKHLVGAWAASDPDAAAAAMIQGLRSDAHDWTDSFGQALTSRASMAGEDAAGQWMAGILKQVPDSKRYLVLQTLIDRDLSTARAKGLIAHLEDRDRIELAVVSVDHYGSMYDNRQALRLIQAMPSEELKMQALHEIADRTVRQRPGDRAGNIKRLESLMDKLQLSEAEMQKVFESTAEK